MNCPKCGAELTPEQAVCVNCGQALVKNTKKKNKYKANIRMMAKFNFIEWCKYQKYMDKY